jgi:hypothetical protein
MLFAIEPEDVERYAIPIGVGIAVLLGVLIPPLRRSLMECFRSGKEAGERWRSVKKNRDDEHEARCRRTEFIPFTVPANGIPFYEAR